MAKAPTTNAKPKPTTKKPAVPIARGKYGGNTPGGKPK